MLTSKIPDNTEKHSNPSSWKTKKSVINAAGQESTTKIVWKKTNYP